MKKYERRFEEGRLDQLLKYIMLSYKNKLKVLDKGFILDRQYSITGIDYSLGGRLVEISIYIDGNVNGENVNKLLLQNKYIPKLFKYTGSIFYPNLENLKTGEKSETTELTYTLSL